MTEKRFIKGYHTIRDTYENKTYDFRVDIICDLLNELDEKWVGEFSLRETLQQELQRVEEENKNLKQDKTNLHRAMSRDRVRYLNENEQLKEDNMLLIEDSEKYRKLSIQFDNRNKELISENEQLKTTISRLIEQNRKNNDLLVSDIRLLEKALWCPNCTRNIKRLKELKKEFEND